MNKTKQFIGRTYLLLAIPIIFPLESLLNIGKEFWHFVSNIPYTIRNSTRTLWKVWKRSWDMLGMSKAEQTRIEINKELALLPRLTDGSIMGNLEIQGKPYKQWFQATYNEPFDIHTAGCDCRECEG